MKKKLLSLVLAVMVMFAMTPQMGGIVYADDPPAGITLPQGAPFTAVTCDSGDPISIVEQEDQVDAGSYGTAPLYLVTVPEGTNTVSATFPKDSVFYANEGGKDVVYGYGYENLVFNDNNWALAYQTMPAKVDGDNVTISLNVADFLNEENKAVGPETPMDDGNKPVCAFTFAYGEEPAQHVHSWGEWTKLDDKQHQRACQGCTEVETENHTWNDGVETTPAQETEPGVKTYTCTACGAEKTEVIPALDGKIRISNAEELVDFLTNAPKDSVVLLTADIDMKDVTWTAKGLFSGSFDGQNHTIKNVSGDHGLFIKVGGANASNRAEVKNLTVEGSITSKGGNVSAFAHTAYYAAFSNCINKADVISTSTSSGDVGGIVGRAQQTTGKGSVSFTNCGNEGAVAGANGVGGIFGYGQSQIDLECCYNKGNITGKGATDSTRGTGGIGGFVQGYQTACTMKNLYNNGDVSGKQAVGGLIGSMRNGVSITNGYNSGAITGTSMLGAIAGSAYNASSSKAVNCYYLEGSCAQAAQGNAPAGVNGGSTAKTNEELQTAAMIDQLGGAFAASEKYPIFVWEVYGPNATLYNVTPPKVSGVEFGGALIASSEDAYTFKISVDKYHKITDNFAVKINGTAIDPESVSGKEYTFKVAEPSCDMTITVEGVESAKTAIWTGNDNLPIAGAYVHAINIYDVKVDDVKVDGTTINVTLAEGTAVNQVIPFVVEVGGAAGNRPTVTPGTAFDKKLAGGQLIQKIHADSHIGGHEATWYVNINVKNAPEPETVNVIKPETDLFSVTGLDKAVKGADYVFTVDIDSRHHATDAFKVKVNDAVIEPVNGEYTVENVQEDLTITVEGVALLTFDHIIAVTPDGEEEIVDDHAKVLKGRYDVEMGTFASSETEIYHGVPYYHVAVPYGTEKVRVAYPDYVYSTAHGQEGGSGNCWSSNTVTVKEFVPQKGPGTNSGFVKFTRDTDNNKVIELDVKQYLVKENGNGVGFSVIGETGGNKPGFYGVISFEVSPCEHKANHMKKTDEVPAGCETDGTEAYWTCDLCNKMFSDEAGTSEITEPVAIKGGHLWGEPEYTWADDNSKVTAKVVCTRNDSHFEQEEAITTKEVTDSTCEGKGAITFTAKFENELFETQTKLIEGEGAKGHKWDGGKVTKDPTTTSTGVMTYTCTVCQKTKTEIIPKLTEAKALSKGASAAAADKVITAMKNDKDPKGSAYLPLKLSASKVTKKAVTIAWAKPKGSAKFVIYGNQCGAKNKMKKLATVKGKKKAFTKIAGKKVKKGTAYKFLIVALDKNNKVVSTSKVIHAYTTGGKITNHKSVTMQMKSGKKFKTVKAAKVKKGKTVQIRGVGVKASKKLAAKTHVKMRYESSNNKIATVNAKGVVKGVKKGTCYVYAYSQNGIAKRIKVTVK